MWLLKIFLLIFIKSSLQASNPTSPTYEAGVVEFFAGSTGDWTNPNVTQRLLEYLKIMDDAATTLDIIVFPEMTFNTMDTAAEIPEVEDKVSPCNHENFADGNLIKEISCSAKKHQRYVVLNVVTKAKCPDKEMLANDDPRDCADRDDGFSYYNTNVVFDRNGTVISRYRKFNLFGENVDKPLKPTMETFDTDFGVRFGHFICFDIAFEKPAFELVRNYNLSDIIFPTMWFSEMPFLTAVQVQQMYAHANNINLLASGANNVGVGSTGTGIYGGRKGAYVSDMAGVNKTVLHTATVYKIKGFPQNENVAIEHRVESYTKEQMRSLFLKRDQLDVYEIDFSNDTDGLHYQEKDICRDDFCCKIKVNYTITNSERTSHYQYALAFNHGIRTFDGFADGGVAACTVFACPTTNISSCGTRNEQLQNIHIWNSIEIEAEFPYKDGNYLYMPTTLDTSITPLQPGYFKYETEDLGNDKVKITMKLETHAANLITFGVYGRDFTLDKDNASVRSLSTLLLFISMFITAINRFF